MREPQSPPSRGAGSAPGLGSPARCRRAPFRLPPCRAPRAGSSLPAADSSERQEAAQALSNEAVSAAGCGFCNLLRASTGGAPLIPTGCPAACRTSANQCTPQEPDEPLCGWRSAKLSALHITCPATPWQQHRHLPIGADLVANLTLQDEGKMCDLEYLWEFPQETHEGGSLIKIPMAFSQKEKKNPKMHKEPQKTSNS